MNINKRFAFLVNFFYFGIIIFLVYLLLSYALPMVTPFALGFIIAYLLRGPSQHLSRLLPLSNRTASLLMVLLFYCTIGLLITFLSIRAFSVSKNLLINIPAIYSLHIEPALMNLFESIEDWTQNMDPSLEATLEELFNQTLMNMRALVSELSVSAMGMVSGAAFSLPGFFIKVVLLIISTFFIALDYDILMGFCMRQLRGHTKELVMQIKEYVIGTLFICIRSYALIMSITFVELSIGFTIIGIRYSFLIAFMISIFDVLPVLGTGGIMLPWVVLSAFQGNIPLALKLLIIYIAVTVIRNIIEPKIVGSQIGLHPIVTLVSMFVGVQMFGVLGLFGFPIGLSLLRHLNDTGVIRVFK